MPAFSIRTYQPGDEVGVLDLLRQALGDGRAFDRTSAFWRWKHFQNPFGPSLLMVAVNNEIAGLRAFMRWRFRVGAHTVTAVRAVDTATHPAYRRHGVFSTLTSLTVDRARAEGVDLIFNTPNRFSLPGYLKLGWTYIGRPHLLVRVLKPARIARALLRGSAEPEDDGSVPKVPMVPLEMLLAKADGLRSLLAENNALCADRIRTDRSIAFLRWRYGGAPTLPYYAYWREGEPRTAVAIFRPNRRRGLREIMLGELLLGGSAVPDAAAVIRELIDAVEADYLVAHAPRGSVHARVLRRAGFIPIPRLGPYFTVRPLSPLAAQVAATRPAQWHLSLGDLEVF